MLLAGHSGFSASACKFGCPFLSGTNFVVVVASMCKKLSQREIDADVDVNVSSALGCYNTTAVSKIQPYMYTQTPIPSKIHHVDCLHRTDDAGVCSESHTQYNHDVPKHLNDTSVLKYLLPPQSILAVLCPGLIDTARISLRLWDNRSGRVNHAERPA